MGHLGSRVSALLDGQLSPDEVERAWAHVHACHQCRDQVEHEGWVKTRLAGLAPSGGGAPAGLKGSLLGAPSALGSSSYLRSTSSALSSGLPSGLSAHLLPTSRARVSGGLVAIGGGAVGAAVMGVLALGAAPADAPTTDRRAPVTQLVRPASTITPSVPAPATRPAP